MSKKFPPASQSSSGGVKLNKDLGGSDDSPIVIGIQGNFVSSEKPSDGYVLSWNAIDKQWEPSLLSTPSGAVGATGPKGSTGSIGPQGSQGSPGVTGPTGPAGSQGSQGSPGITGVTGPQGPQGSQGSTGSIGPQGVQGSPGVTGTQGSTGTIGATGPTGPAGATGSIGSTGPTGPQGSPGVTGAPGINAYSTSAGFTQPAVGAAIAIQVPSGQWMQIGQSVFIPSGGYYQVASGSVPTFSIKNLGYSGVNLPVGSTISAAFVSPAGIAGFTGVTGPQGATGPTGPTGPQGATGVQGITGVTGPTGPQGPTGTIGATGPIGGITGTAGGNLTGTYPNPTVNKINGVAVPSALTATTGMVMQIIGPTALTYDFISDQNVGTAAAISGTKINPNFGTQNITTSGMVLAGTGTFNGPLTAFSVNATGAAAFMSIGTGVSTTGQLRFGSVATQVAIRNKANTGDFAAISSDVNDQLILGSTSWTSAILTSGGNNILRGASIFAQDSAGAANRIVISSVNIGGALPFGGSSTDSKPFQILRRTASFSTDANITLNNAQYDGGIVEVSSSVPLTATRDVIAPLVSGAFLIVNNQTTGGQSIRVIGSSGTGVTISNGTRELCYSDGTNWVAAVIQLAGDLGGTTDLPVVRSISGVTAGVTGAITTNVPITAAQTTLNSASLVPVVGNSTSYQSTGATGLVQIYTHPDNTLGDWTTTVIGRDHSNNGSFWRGDFIFTTQRFNNGSGVGTGPIMSPSGPVAINIRSAGTGVAGPSGFVGGYSPSIQVSGTNINVLFGITTGTIDWNIVSQIAIRQ